ncbi:MAG: hypothetical protein A3D24_02140 [Candidatus Blackburnbacteria bacterium RIFCSPHIGHO2_02_FULL_39_13]|nr:MAG: hypothetical protein A3D24_02140 [Candidatus Blackburnbacteria bacterium RIFCSPHIGHO2_02_FULL_39_13]
MNLRVNWFLFLPALLLTILGTVILSSVSPKSFPQQFFNLGLALLTYLLFSQIDLRVLRSLSGIFYLLSIVLLVITFVFGFVSHGAVRWINLGFFTIQPSEVVKPLSILFFASVVSWPKGDKKYLYSVLALIPAIALVLLQPDLGSSLVVFTGFIGVILLAGIPIRYLLGAAIIFMLTTPLIWQILAGYQQDRLLSYLKPASDPLGSGYNSIQSMIAIGSGQFLGRGLGQGTQSQLLFLPERHTDFIFAALSEELGFVGSGLLLLAFAIMLSKIVLSVRDSTDVFTKALLGGIFLSIFSQAAINIGMNLGIMPVTGIPLPFVSSGGSSLISMSAMIGMATLAIHSLKGGRNSGIL